MKKFNEFHKEEVLSEVKLARVWKHLTDEKTNVGIITAFRGEYDYKENTRRNKELTNKLRDLGYGYFLVDGSWIENEGTPDEKEVSEVSVFTTSTGDSNEFRKNLTELAKKYDQDGFSFKDADSKSNKYEIVDKNGNTMLSFNNVKFNKLANVYTKMRNKKGSFVFESTAYSRGGFIKHLLSNEKQD